MNQLHKISTTGSIISRAYPSSGYLEAIVN